MKQKILKLTFLLTICLKANAQDISIPDTNFEKALIDLNLDTNGLNGTISRKDATKIVVLDIHDPLNNEHLKNVKSKITDLTGIQEFKNLVELTCFGNEITQLDLSGNNKLSILNCNENQLTSLDLSNNPILNVVNVDNNKISDLIIGTKVDLQELYCSQNTFSSLDVTGCPKLFSLDATVNESLGEVLYNNQVNEETVKQWYGNENTVFKGVDLEISSAEKQEYKSLLRKKTKLFEAYLIKKYTTKTKQTTQEIKSDGKDIAEQAIVSELEETLRKKIEELKQKHNLTQEEIKIWVNSYSKMFYIN